MMSILELKLDAGTMFEWQKYSSGSVDVPHCNELLEFVNLRAQASEHSINESTKRATNEVHKSFASKLVPAYAVNVIPVT